MKSKPKPTTRLQTALVLLAVAATLLFFAWLCIISTYYQFDGVAPCTPESPVCITEMAR